MLPFTYYTPTKVYFGADAEDHIGADLKSRGATKVLIHYGSERIKKDGLFDRVVGQLDGAGIAWVELGGVEPNPKVTLVRKGIELCRAEGVDFILGVGGGSVADSCKAMRLGLALDVDPWEAVTKNMVPAKPFPMGIVLTMAAAGSEMSNSCVLSDAGAHLKRGCNHDANRPEVAFMNPANTLTVPPYQTAAGVVDIMMHTMERFLFNAPETPLTDAIAVAILRTVRDCGTRLIAEPFDLDARADVMWASSLAHNNLTECGRGKTFTAHKIEHDISGAHDNVTHGAGLAVVFPAWVLYEYKCDVDRFADWAVRVWDAEMHEDKEQTVLEGVEKMRAYFRSLGMPTHMSELGVTPDEYEYISGLTTNGGANTIPSYRGALTQEDIIAIYKLAE